MRANRRDANEAALVDFWRSAGCIWIPMVPGQGFDGLLIYHDGVAIVEIKNPSKAWSLTEAELDLSRRVEELGGEYHVVETLHEAACLIGLAVNGY